MSARILIVAQRARLAALKSLFPVPEFLAQGEWDASRAFERAGSCDPHLVLLELGPASFKLLKRLVARGVKAIFVLSEAGSEAELIEALNVGAFSGLTRPFADAELVARVRSCLRLLGQLRRPSPDGVWLDPQRQSVWIKKKPVRLTVKEFAVLEMLADAAGRVLTRQQILEGCWSYESPKSPRNVDFQIFRLRRKLGVYGVRIESVPRLGYFLQFLSDI